MRQITGEPFANIPDGVITDAIVCAFYSDGKIFLYLEGGLLITYVVGNVVFENMQSFASLQNLTNLTFRYFSLNAQQLAFKENKGRDHISMFFRNGLHVYSDVDVLVICETNGDYRREFSLPKST